MRETGSDNNKRLVLSLSWRDIKSPGAGGAEIHTHELLKSINKDKYDVVHIAFAYDGLAESEFIDGVEYRRHGSFISFILFARKIYRANMSRIAVVFDQCNTYRSFTPFWVKACHRVFYIHQLTREIWHIQSKGIGAWIGEHTETAMLKLNRHDHAITVSESTRKDLIDVGFDPEKILIVRNGLPGELVDYAEDLSKESVPTFIYVGRYAKYKGIDDTIVAFGRFKAEYPKAVLWLVGKPDEDYLDNTLMPICRKFNLSVSRDPDSNPDVCIWGFVSEQDKYRLMQRAHVLICPSIREGWGIIISEAGYLGTPSIVYDSPGIRDAVDYGRAGYLCQKNTPEEIEILMRRSMTDKDGYNEMRIACKSFSSGLRWEYNTKPVNDFIDSIDSKQQQGSF